MMSRRGEMMPIDNPAQRGGIRRDAYSPSLQQTAAALWGDGFWGRDEPLRENAERNKPAEQR